MRISPYAPLVPIAQERPPFLGLVRRRPCLVPTWRGWCVLLIAMSLTAFFTIRGLYGFLAVQDPVHGGVMVIEGWVEDYVLADALSEFRAHRYEGIWVTGDPMSKGIALTEYHNSATLSVAMLEKMGADPATLHAVIWDEVRQDRTYASALAVKKHLIADGVSAEKINIVTTGAHARRSRLLYEKAFGSGSRIGIIAVKDSGFDTAHWWQSSTGFRGVTGEAIAYVYARFVFHGR